ncbi:MAG: phosphatidylserine decarboxylase [Bdellovibrionales bacterium]|nr:phosphatidylserine decarboxylase [Bdellovibrionales bacterium]
MPFYILHYLSWITGKLASIEHPKFLVQIAIRIFAYFVAANLNEAEKDITEYSSVQNFFTRKLKPGVREIETGLVSPVDGTLRAWGSVADDKFTELKGRQYSLVDLFSNKEAANRFKEYNFFNLYLSPKDYHHVHSPFNVEIYRIDHIPGSLWPVNNWAIKNIDGLFFSNERVVFYLNSSVGEIVLIMIGATNVGQIKVPFADFTSNQAPWSRTNLKTINCNYPIQVKKAELLGSFLLGSSVLLLVPKSLSLCPKVNQENNYAIKLGMQIAL